ncbi:MAG: hypothetical protein IKS84_06085 [Lachnospiraceae bacterium]|nr:hypothetical protein [Lachnospiraceae bacterium]
MSISNAQYDEIMRAFENNRNNNRHLLMQRRDEVYDKIPEYKALDSKVADISLKLGMELIDGDASALASLWEEIKGITEK